MATTVGMASAGSALVTGLLAASAVKYVGWGIGTSAYAATDTALGTASAEARTSGTQTQQQTDHTNDTYRCVALITCASAAKAITEAAIFDQLASGGNLYVRANFAAVNVDVADTITFTFNTKHDHS